MLTHFSVNLVQAIEVWLKGKANVIYNMELGEILISHYSKLKKTRTCCLEGVAPSQKIGMTPTYQANKNQASLKLLLPKRQRGKDPNQTNLYFLQETYWIWLFKHILRLNFCV